MIVRTTKMQNSVTQLFSFSLDLLGYFGQLCFIRNSTPVINALSRIAFVPLLLLMTLFLYLFLKPFQKYFALLHNIGDKMKLAFLFAVLFSYQQIATTVFSFLYCVPVYERKVLFLDGNVQCYQAWQYFVFLEAVFCVLPFSVFLMFAPGLLHNNKMTMTTFFLGCFFPGPTFLYLTPFHLFRKGKCRKEPSNSACKIHECLQGPYREISITFFAKSLPCCWTGVLFLRRLMLILIFTFSHNVSYRLIMMTSVCLTYQFCQSYVQPYKDRCANLASSLSSLALIIICLINLIRAIFEITEHIPDRSTKPLIDFLANLENALLLWVPIIGVLTFIVLKVYKFVTNKIARHKLWA